MSARSWRQCECEGKLARGNGADVGRVAKTCRGRSRADRTWRRRQCPLEREQMGTAEFGRTARKMAAAGRLDAAWNSPPDRVASLAFRSWCEGGAEINAADPDGITPAAFRHHQRSLRCATLLLEKGADPEHRRTARAGRRCTPPSISIPCRHRTGRRPKKSTTNSTSLDVVKSLLAKGADVNAQLKQQQPYRTKLDRGDDTMLTTGRRLWFARQKPATSQR